MENDLAYDLDPDRLRCPCALQCVACGHGVGLGEETEPRSTSLFLFCVWDETEVGSAPRSLPPVFSLEGREAAMKILLLLITTTAACSDYCSYVDDYGVCHVKGTAKPPARDDVEFVMEVKLMQAEVMYGIDASTIFDGIEVVWGRGALVTYDTDTKTRLGMYRRRSRTIWLRKYHKGKTVWPVVLSHEYGHHVYYELYGHGDSKHQDCAWWQFWGSSKCELEKELGEK